MYKKYNLKKQFLLISILFAGFIFQSCKTTRSITKEAFAPDAPDDSTFIVAHDIVFPETDGDYKYIFFRLYNPIYKNPLYIANLLKGGINSTRMENDPEVSHASINFSLDDNYYGLTLCGGDNQLAEEECAIPENNEYMKKCDPEKSEQITYALKVTEEEYERTRMFVQTYVERNDIRYATGLNFKIALFSIKRKFFTPKERQEFGSLIYPDDARNKKANIVYNELESNFVCSTFIGYVLYNNVESVSKFFDENNIKYEYLNVADIGQIPGIVPIFYSNWDNYGEAARAFVKEYPEFAEYLKE